MENQEYVLSRQILRLANLIITTRNREIRGLGLTTEQADALRYFEANDRKSAVDLKGHLGITHQATRGIVARMADKGLVQLDVSDLDGRYKTVTLTPQGRALCKQMRENCTHTGHQLLAGMDDQERDTFSRLVACALDHLEGPV